MYKDIFVSLGLSPSEATIYEYLIKSGRVSAGKIISGTHLKRGTVYGDLKNLIGKEMVSIIKKERMAYFSPKHPAKLAGLVEDEKNRLKKAKGTLENQFSAILSNFNLISGQPGIACLEGFEGLEYVYAEIIKAGEDILLFRSISDNDSPKIDKLVKNQIAKQIKRNIHTKAITPLVLDTPFSVIAKDIKNLVERRIVPKERFSLPAQIIVFKNKVAITSLDKNIITTIIENDSINLSFRVIFNFIWELSTPIHEKYYQQIINKK